jgi:hypothetical protein
MLNVSLKVYVLHIYIYSTVPLLTERTLYNIYSYIHISSACCHVIYITVVRIVHVLTVPLIVHFYNIYSYIPISSAYCPCYIHNGSAYFTNEFCEVTVI